jgi:hypothetical protein
MSKDSVGNVAYSSDQTFTTNAGWFHDLQHVD